MFLRFISPRLAEIARLEPFTWQKATQPSRVPRVSREGAPGRQATLSSSVSRVAQLAGAPSPM